MRFLEIILITHHHTSSSSSPSSSHIITHILILILLHVPILHVPILITHHHTCPHPPCPHPSCPHPNHTSSHIPPSHILILLRVLDSRAHPCSYPRPVTSVTFKLPFFFMFLIYLSKSLPLHPSSHPHILFFYPHLDIILPSQYHVGSISFLASS